MKILKIGVLLLIGAILLIVLIGFALPQNHVASLSAEFDASPTQVWEAITEVRDYPEWRSGVESVEVTSTQGELLSWIERGSAGEIPLSVESQAAPRSLVTRIDSQVLPFGGSWSYEIEALTADRARLTITENGEVYNPFYRFVSRFVMGHTATIEAYLVDLGMLLEG